LRHRVAEQAARAAAAAPISSGDERSSWLAVQSSRGVREVFIREYPDGDAHGKATADLGNPTGSWERHEAAGLAG
jgi:hypothetical protein